MNDTQSLSYAEMYMNQRYEVTARIMDGKHIVGFIMNGELCGEKRITKEAALRLAKQNKIINAKLCGATLSGVGIELKSLPTISMKDIHYN